MTSVLSVGKYRSRKEWSTNSIPKLVSLEEETGPIIKINGIPPKPPRRSSITAGLLGGRSTDKNNKRRSSIAVAFLGRRDISQKVRTNKLKNKKLFN